MASEFHWRQDPSHVTVFEFKATCSVASIESDGAGARKPALALPVARVSSRGSDTPGGGFRVAAPSAAPRGAAIVFTETLAHGAASWQNDEPRYGLFYKFNDRSAIYHAQESRRPSAEAFVQMTDNQKCYFNLAYQAFGPADNPRNEEPQFG